MRTGVLSNSQIIKLLNKHYVSVFLLLRDLPELQNGVRGEQASQLATVILNTYEAAIEHGGAHSVNSFIVSPESELIGHFPYRGKNKEKRYVTYLKVSMEASTKH